MSETNTHTPTVPFADGPLDTIPVNTVGELRNFMQTRDDNALLTVLNTDGTQELKITRIAYGITPPDMRLFVSPHTPPVAMDVMSKMQFVYPCSRKPDGWQLLSTFNNVQIMMDGGGLLCRMAQIYAVQNDLVFKTAVILHDVVGPQAVMEIFMKLLQSDKGKPKLVMVSPTGLIKPLNNVKLTDVEMSAVSSGMVITQKITAVSTTVLE